MRRLHQPNPASLQMARNRGQTETAALAGPSTDPDRGWASPAAPPGPFPPRGPHCTLSPRLLGPPGLRESVGPPWLFVSLVILGRSGPIFAPMPPHWVCLVFLGRDGSQRRGALVTDQVPESTRLAAGLDHLEKVCFHVSPPAGSLSVEAGHWARLVPQGREDSAAPPKGISPRDWESLSEEGSCLLSTSSPGLTSSGAPGYGPVVVVVCYSKWSSFDLWEP